MYSGPMNEHTILSPVNVGSEHATLPHKHRETNKHEGYGMMLTIEIKARLSK